VAAAAWSHGSGCRPIHLMQTPKQTERLTHRSSTVRPRLTRNIDMVVMNVNDSWLNVPVLQMQLQWTVMRWEILTMMGRTLMMLS